MTITLRPLTHADIDDHIAGEDEQSVRWFTGGRGTVDTATRHFDELAENARIGTGKRGFGVWRGDRLVGYVDADPDNDDGLQPDDVNIGYAVHPWARGSGVAVEAVALICGFICDHALGSRAAIRVEPENEASIRVAEKAGFSRLDDFVSATDAHPDGAPSCSGCTSTSCDPPRPLPCRSWEPVAMGDRAVNILGVRTVRAPTASGASRHRPLSGTPDSSKR